MRYKFPSYDGSWKLRFMNIGPLLTYDINEWPILTNDLSLHMTVGYWPMLTIDLCKQATLLSTDRHQHLVVTTEKAKDTKPINDCDLTYL